MTSLERKYSVIEIRCLLGSQWSWDLPVCFGTGVINLYIYLRICYSYFLGRYLCQTYILSSICVREWVSLWRQVYRDNYVCIYVGNASVYPFFRSGIYSICLNLYVFSITQSAPYMHKGSVWLVWDLNLVLLFLRLFFHGLISYVNVWEFSN